MLPDLRDVLHDRGDLQLGVPGRVAENRDLLVGMLAVGLHVRLEKPRVGDVIVVEEEQQRGMRGEDAEVLGGRDP